VAHHLKPFRHNITIFRAKERNPGEGMGFKYSTYALKKLETLFEELDYSVLYEKGNFQSGYCIVEQRRVVVVNKFFETEGRINTLLEILGQIEVDESRFSEASMKFYKKLSQSGEDSEPEPDPSIQNPESIE